MRAPSKENSRDRALTDDEIAIFWTATGDMGFPFGPALQLMLLTGQRRGEVSGMRWSQINGTVWTIPAEVAKNERTNN